ncbi:Per1-like protein [Lentinula raphanica]|uniref:Post-GPI attachment to proteins factor 3 n=1 Tax=Lentinula raphanica TaxID=153919 RepID=A0AA38UKV7_9AGAR|nr:Per1-like protein [Lentinula raphanica]KAJ3844979.1 Per1-like protein [Lentinula raphanica]KAJ3973574.1 Per1-like protein [Lentinula raphanica]
MRWIPIFLFQSLCMVAFTSASSGDRSNDFQQCLLRCNDTGECNEDSLSLVLKMTRWTCADNCKYFCMHEITAQSLTSGKTIHQYYGKWPFYRLVAQEPASVAFSFLNLYAHVKGARKLQRELDDSHPMKIYYMGWSFVSMNTWIWSCLFHTRDTAFTEKMDYFSAALTILVALYFTVIRLFHLYALSPSRNSLLAQERSPRSRLRLKLWSATCTLTFLGHISYLNHLERFDYSYNVIFNLGIGLAHNIFWLCYSLPSSLSSLRRFPGRSRRYRPHFVYKPALLVSLITAAMALELLDFPPWFLVFDAHSLWHLSTAPIAYMWYEFLVEDANDDSWKEQRLS